MMKPHIISKTVTDKFKYLFFLCYFKFEYNIQEDIQ